MPKYKNQQDVVLKEFITVQPFIFSINKVNVSTRQGVIWVGSLPKYSVYLGNNSNIQIKTCQITAAYQARRILKSNPLLSIYIFCNVITCNH